MTYCINKAGQRGRESPRADPWCVIHNLECSYRPSAKNRVILDDCETYEDAVECAVRHGFDRDLIKPCDHCLS